MANPIFTVGRRPAVHISYGVAGGPVDQYWCSSANHCKAVIDPGTGLRRSGVTSTTNMNNLSVNTSASATQTIIENCVTYWMDFINRGYVYQPVLYHDDFLINRTIHKRIMQELGKWPVTDPAP
jgi:hypothetical protein